MEKRDAGYTQYFGPWKHLECVFRPRQATSGEVGQVCSFFFAGFSSGGANDNDNSNSNNKSSRTNKAPRVFKTSSALTTAMESKLLPIVHLQIGARELLADQLAYEGISEQGRADADALGPVPSPGASIWRS